MIGKKLGIAASVIALTAMATPAAAQWHGPRRGHHDHDNGGAVAGALIVGGIIGALLASKKKAPETVIEQAPPPPPPVEAAPEPSVFEDAYDEDSATDRCASAAELEGTHYARIAQVDRVTSVVWNGKSWVVKGNLRLTESLRDTARTVRDFRCTLKPGSEPQVSVEGDRA